MKLRNGFRARMRCICAFQVAGVSPLGVGAHADQDELGVVDIEQANVLARKAAIAKLFLQFVRVLGLLGFGQAYAGRTRRCRILDRERETRLRRDVESLLHLAGFLGKLQRVVEMHLRVLECNGVRAFAGGPGCRAMALAARFRHIRTRRSSAASRSAESVTVSTKPQNLCRCSSASDVCFPTDAASGHLPQ